MMLVEEVIVDPSLWLLHLILPVIQVGDGPTKKFEQELIINVRRLQQVPSIPVGGMISIYKLLLMSFNGIYLFAH